MASRSATASPARERFSFANLDEVLPLPDLIAIQRDSFQWFLDRGLADTFRDISPITSVLSIALPMPCHAPDLSRTSPNQTG